jgi:glycosyltransferase involved in cell wall biosynthesis
MRLGFLLPRWSRAPIGGYAVVYEYAARLASLGHDVRVHHMASWTPPRTRSSAAEAVRRLTARGRSAAPVPWVGVPVSSSAHFAPPWRAINSYDRVVVTNWFGAEQAGSRVAPERLLYLIQSDEVWSGPADRVRATWQLPIRKVVIARWLEQLARERSAVPVDYVPNAIDTERFPTLVEPAARTPASVAMLWHEHPVKGSDVGIAVLEAVKAARPELVATLYSIYDRPAHIPSWVQWERRPDHDRLVAIYNNSAVFLSSSRIEGWALPPAEAMSSGCALVTSDIGGVRDYATHGRTALLAASEDVTGLSQQLLTLVDDHALRLQIAAAGARCIRDDFSWARSADQLNHILSRPA